MNKDKDKMFFKERMTEEKEWKKLQDWVRLVGGLVADPSSNPWIRPYSQNYGTVTF